MVVVDPASERPVFLDFSPLAQRLYFHGYCGWIGVVFMLQARDDLRKESRGFRVLRCSSCPH